MSPGDEPEFEPGLQALADRLTCLGMEMAEHLRDVHARFDHVQPDPTSSTEETP